MWTDLSADVKSLANSVVQQALYNKLSKRLHFYYVATPGGVLLVPEFLSPLEKRLLFRVFRVQGYDVKVIDIHDSIRPMEDYEMRTPPTSDRSDHVGVDTQASRSSQVSNFLLPKLFPVIFLIFLFSLFLFFINILFFCGCFFYYYYF
jgi:hypothetical protein